MPKINRFRIVNFKFDDNRKYIADEIFEMEGHNTLINLENGGGKSAMLQLALQVMLPNTQLGSRRMSDYFNLNSGTLHILMEWSLDTAGMLQQYLLTGFCCRKGQDGLNYFMYMRPHTGIDEYTIENIPVLNNKREVTGYHEFYRYIQTLSKESGIRMNLFRQNDQSKYRAQLETYNLFEEEFRAIRTINQSEGGIEKFFEKARTSRQVIERLIIPSIPSGNEEDSGVLVDSLKKHMDNLKMIPELQSRIKTYDSFLEKAENFVVNVKNYAKLYDEHQKIAQNILNLENLLHFALNLGKKEQEEHQYKKMDAESKKTELLYMQDSFAYSRNHQDAGVQEKILDEIKNAISSINLELKSLSLEYNNSLSINDWLEMKELNKKLKEKEAEQKVMQQEKHEWNEEYQRVLSTLEYLYNEKLAKINEDMFLLSDQQKELQDEINKQEKLKVEIVENLKNTDKKLYYVKEDMGRLDRELREIVQQIEGGFGLLLDTKKSLEEIDNEINRLDGEEEKVNDDILKMQEKIESIKTEIDRTKMDITENRKDIESMENALLDINNARESLENRIRNYEIGTSVYKNNVMEKIKAMIENHRLKYNRILSSRLVLENKQLAFSDGGAYIPDYAIKRLVDLFNENDINAIAGSIYIANQNEDVRRNLVERNPYLPYAVIINEQTIDSISFLEDKIINCVEGYPVWIVTGGGKAIVYTGGEYEEGKMGPARLFDRDIFIVNKEAAEFSADEEKFREYAKRLKDKIAGLEEAAKTKQDETSALEKLENEIYKFVEKYPETLVRRKESELSEKINETKSLESSLGTLKKRLDELKAEIIKSNEKLDDIRTRNSHIQSQRKLIEQYVKKSEEIDSRKKQADRLSDELASIKRNHDSIERELNGLKSKLQDLKNKADSMEKAKEDIEQRFDNVRSSIDGNYQKLDTSETMEELEATKSALEKNLGDVNMNYLQELIQNYRQNISKYESSINDRKTDISWLEINRVRVSQSRIEELKQKLQEIEDEKGVKLKEETVVKGKIDILIDRMERMKKDIWKKYEKEPHLFGEITDEQEKQLRDGILTEDKKLLRLVKKLSLIGQRIDSLNNIIDRVSEFITDNELKKYAGVTEAGAFHTKHRVIDMWDISSIPDRQIAVFYNEAREGYRKSEDELSTSKEKIEKEFGRLYEDNELNTNQNIRGLMSRIGETDIFNHEVIERIFKNVFTSIENLKQAAQAQLENQEKDRKEMVLRCLRKARVVYDEVKSVDRFSRITVGNNKERTIKIKTPPVYEEQAENMMGQYLDACISELTNIRSDGSFDPARIEDEIRKRMKPTNLLDAIAPLNSFRIEVLKPGHNMEISRYIEWESIVSWSGGEKLAGFFAMFIAIISYLRYKKTQWYDSTKVIWIDNPFGQANAGYLLDYIFELANTTNTQVICLTGLQETTIYEKFDVVYSLVHRMLGAGNSVIRSTKIKENTGINSGMYKIHHEQMSLL